MQWRTAFVAKGVVTLLAVALASLTLVTAPALAGNGDDIDYAATYSACVGAATNSAGLQDVVGTRFESAVNCLAHYGITQGTPDGSYQPQHPVTRAQMALFLTRAAGPSGIALGNGTPQGFTDINDLSATAQIAINQLAELGIAKGKSADRFDPHGTVTRAQMVLFLDRFLSKAVLGPGAAGVVGYQPPTFNTSQITSDKDPFTDLSQLSAPSRQAVQRLYELGITKGATATTFEGRRKVTRGQMALFISRMLAHTNARPAGITIQADRSHTFFEVIRLVVSVRDADHQPADLARVDVFQVPPDTSNDDEQSNSAFDTEGKCQFEGSPVVVSAVRGDLTSCAIVGGEGILDTRGNIVDTYMTRSSGTVWAWQGSLGSTFNRHQTPAATVALTVGAPALTTVITHTLAQEATVAMFGTTVTFSIQLVDDSSEPVAQPDRPLQVRVIRTNNGKVDSVVTDIHHTDSNGRVTLTYTVQDPNPGSFNIGDTVELAVTTAFGDGLLASNRSTVTWTDEAPVSQSLLISFFDGPFKEASDHQEGVVNVVRATLSDQFGRPLSGRRITFSSDDSSGIGEFGAGLSRAETVVHTDSNGVAMLRYRRDDASSRRETIMATDEGFTVTATSEFYWIQGCHDSTCDVDDAPVAVLDTDTNLILYYDGANDLYTTITYRARDQFSFNNAFMRIADFEAAYLEHSTAHQQPDYTVSISGYSDDGSRPAIIDFTASS